jgi:hypothetical protein
MKVRNARIKRATYRASRTVPDESSSPIFVLKACWMFVEQSGAVAFSRGMGLSLRR